ncbi:MAG: N-glycosylase/DNA lyase [Bacteroidales bacterium]|nr:N-glycosylase/DNA lyase [Bacteroidales bacterium]
MNELPDILKNIKVDVNNRINEFKLIWKEADEKRLFQELIFCILTPQSKAKNAWKAVTSLNESGILFNATSEKISNELNIVRFKNNKARYIIDARNLFANSDGFKIRNLLNDAGDVFEKRKWLVKNVKGIGFKEASHYLRNIGFVENIAILDRHILKNLKIYNVINEIPKSLTFGKYIRIENKMKDFSREINISLEFLDFVFWYKETGEIFK